MNRENEGSQEAGQIEGRYANYFEVGHNAFEFLLDFGQLYFEKGSAHPHTRIITGPAYAKALLHVLGESIDRYEQIFGKILSEGMEKNPKC